MRPAARALLFAAFLGVPIVVSLFWRARAETPENQPNPPKLSLASSDTLGGADRYLTHLSTDKPIYRPGESLYARGVILHHRTRKPMPEGQTQAVVEIRGPKGDTVASGWVAAEDSLLGYQWDIPAELPGGQYTIDVSYPHSGQPPAERKFEIRAYRAPRLKSQIKFLRDGYGPGDEVVATLEVERAEGGVPAGAEVTAIARVDGQEIYRGKTAVDDQGNCSSRFQLPEEIQRGEGTLAFVIDDGGAVETASKTIPILLQTVDLTMYPEGGELIAGLPNRVYFEAFTPAKKPADLAGEVLDASGRKVATFRSEHEGRGRFEFTPKVDGQYQLKITEPSGIKTQYPLPDVQSHGAVLQAIRGVCAAGKPVRMKVGTPDKTQLTVTISKREQVVARQTIEFGAQGTAAAGKLEKIRFELPEDVDGVLVATIWNADGKPLAERLIFRESARAVRVEVVAEQSPYVPGGRAQLKVRTTDDKGQPISALVGLTVTDDSVLEMIERREQAPRLPVMVMLEDEVQELADAHVYLDPENPLASTAVDLLLGTQGWRRFAYVDPAALIAEHGKKARRALAARIPVLGYTWGGMGGGMQPGEIFKGSDEMENLDERRGFEMVQEGAANEMPVDEMPAGEAAPVELAEAKEEAADRPVEPIVAEPPMADREMLGGRQPAGFAMPEAEQRMAQAARRAELAAEADMLLPATSAPVPIRNDFVAVRIYAHQVRLDRQPGQRSDFTETLFWHAGLRTDESGEASIEFGLNDSVTSFRVLADAFSSDGALGAGTTQIESVEPFYTEPKLPLELTMGDRVQLPIGMVNATGSPLDVSVRVDSESLKVIQPTIGPLPLDAGQRERQLVELLVGDYQGEATVTVDATAGPYSDRVTRTLLVKPLGFPAEDGVGGLVGTGAKVRHEFEIPADMVPGSLSCRAVVYPTPLASLNEALERLIQEPCGCFEQTSSTVYPLVMAQQYFMSHQGVDPSLIERSSTVLQKGYDRLMGYECPSGGFEWWGADPGHDALTAYGLMEFTDMAEVRFVEPELLERTRQWLLQQRDGQGGFVRKTHTYHTWLAEPEIAFSYNTWGLLSADVKADLAREIEYVSRVAGVTENTYVTALGANVTALAGDKDATNQLLDRLAGKQSDDGSLSGATTSVVGSGGLALQIETTALAALAWLSHPRYAGNVEEAIRFLAESCKSGRFGSTQSTVLALKAIIAYDQSRAHPKAPGTLQLIVDGTAVGEPVAFGADTQGVIELPDAASHLTVGKHVVQLAMTDGSEMPYSVALEYNRLQPDSSADCKLHLETKLRDVELEEGNATEAEVIVINRTDETLPMPLAIVGIPGGLEVRHDQLKELVKAGEIAAYEVRGREVVLYWRAMKPEERIDVRVSLIAAVPGQYTAPASRAYLYYTDEDKVWVEGIHATVRPLE